MPIVSFQLMFYLLPSLAITLAVGGLPLSLAACMYESHSQAFLSADKHTPTDGS